MNHPHFQGDPTVAQYFEIQGSDSWTLGKNSLKTGLGYYGPRPGYTEAEWTNHYANGKNVYYETPNTKKKTSFSTKD